MGVELEPLLRRLLPFSAAKACILVNSSGSKRVSIYSLLDFLRSWLICIKSANSKTLYKESSPLLSSIECGYRQSIVGHIKMQLTSLPIVNFSR